MATTGGRKPPKAAKVHNKMPAESQITAEQLMREAKERELEVVVPPPVQKISDHEELNDYKLRKRKEYEDGIRKNRSRVQNWLKYAKFEENMGEIDRARSIYERALDVDYRSIHLWLKYAEMEMKMKQINHARNLWDRAVTLLPRANQFWFKYTYMEEMLGNVVGARSVFERWMEWEPEERCWFTYINFEVRYRELDNARNLYEKLIRLHPEPRHWIKYARFEEHGGFIAKARSVYERGVEFFGEEFADEALFVAFAKFEENQKEHERARVIYKYALEKIPKEKCSDLFKNYTIHEKKFGNRLAVENVIVNKRRFQYEKEIEVNPLNFDAWFDYLRLIESDGTISEIRDTYERAIAHVPPVNEKRSWRRYIYLWINYALFEELDAEDLERTNDVYSTCLQVIPHKYFTFAKIWLLYAEFEVRRKNLPAARKILGTAIGKCAKYKLFKSYIELELQLREFDRCRTLYQKFLEFVPENCSVWLKFAELEVLLGDIPRARAIYALAIKQPVLDMPEMLWKAYIDFEMEQEEYENVRDLYRALLEKSHHIKVWLSFAKFEASLQNDKAIENAREIFVEASSMFKNANEKEERMMLLQAWKEFETNHGDVKVVEKLMPKQVKKRRAITLKDGSDGGFEEYYDYIFPDDNSSQNNFKLLSMAKKWTNAENDSDSNIDSDSELSSEDSDFG